MRYRYTDFEVKALLPTFLPIMYSSKILKRCKANLINTFGANKQFQIFFSDFEVYGLLNIKTNKIKTDSLYHNLLKLSLKAVMIEGRLRLWLQWSRIRPKNRSAQFVRVRPKNQNNSMTKNWLQW